MKRPDSFSYTEQAAYQAEQVRQEQQRQDREGPGAPVRSQDYERANPAFAFRIRPEDKERLGALAQELEVTHDALARGLVQAMLDALDEERLTLEVERVPIQKRDKKGRIRSNVQAIVSPVWNDATDL